MESIPHVSVGQIVGLLGILNNTPDLESIYDIGAEIGKEFGETVKVCKAITNSDVYYESASFKIELPHYEARMREQRRQLSRRGQRR